MKVVVTGASGGLGRTLIPLLCADPRVQSVVGIDRVPMVFGHPKFSGHIQDTRSPELNGLMAKSDAVVHLAFAIRRGQMSSTEMWENNVLGTRNVLSASRSAAVKKVVNLSSVSVYGTGENLTEDAPLDPSPYFPYACHKAEAETQARTDFDDLEIVNLRSTFILGKNAIPFLRKMCSSRVYIAPSRPHPLIQVVHEKDVAAAIVAALQPNVKGGAINLAAPDRITFPRLIRHDRLLTLGLPLRLIDRITRKHSNAEEVRPIDSALALLRVTLTVSCEKARRVLGWIPRYSAWQARADISN